MTEQAENSAPGPAAPVRSSWMDAFLAVLVAAFAFLAASFPVRNGDFWMHLAAGRLLTRGEYTFGVDPFAYTTDGLYWANHAWLFDLLLYAGFRFLGPAGLAVLKAAAILGLAALMLRLARSRDETTGPFWLQAGLILLAVLALSPQLLLRPACFSLLLLALCLLLLREGGRAFYAVPAIVVLWVNLDAWFLLGPVLVALFWLGDRLARTDTQRQPVWLLPACLLACLVNPHHLHALTLPGELSPAVWMSDFRSDPRFTGLFASPWQFGRDNLAAWAFVALLVLGPVSFAVNRPALRSWRLPVWLLFALLAAWQARLIPFFAVVAGPITALNLGERLPRSVLARSGGAGVVLAGLTLVALTWPGWLQGFQRRDRGLGWGVEPDSSLRQVALTLERLRKQGALPSDARTLATHPDVAHYCAWFNPGERSFLDARLPLFVGVAANYRNLGRDADPAEHESLLRQHRVVCVVLYDPDLRRLAPALRQAASREGNDLLHVAGQAIIVGVPGVTGGPSPFDADRVVFSSAEAEAVPVADDGPAELTRPLPWWEEFLRRPSGSAWESDAAAVYLRLFEESTSQQLQEHQKPVLARHAAGLAGLSAGDAFGTVSRLGLENVFLADLRHRPAALPLLSVRAARRAVAAHPDDANAWMVLAQAYFFLSRTTGEGVLPPLAEIRDIQSATALVQALTLRPDLAVAHEKLALLFAERQYYDLALRHRTKQLDLVRRAGRAPGEEAAAFLARVEPLERAVDEMRSAVQTSENRYAVRADPLAGDPLARARLALELGLAGKAVDDVLLRSHPDLYGVDGLRLLLELLLRTGRAQDARDLLDRAELRRKPDGLGVYDLPAMRLDGRRWIYRFPAYDWFDLCEYAAAGRYDRASGVLDRLRGRLSQQSNAFASQLTPSLALRLTAEVGLAMAPETAPLRLYQRMGRDREMSLLLDSWFVPVEVADLHTLEGMLLLERGLPARAGEQFRLAVELYERADANVPALPGLPLARRYRERIR